jgi:general secretion pathway protein J
MIMRCASISAYKPDDKGFSLIELLVSLVLLSLILLALPGALQLSRRTWELSDDLDRITATRAAMGFMEHRLAQAMPLYQRGIDGRLQISFWGRPDSVTFISPSSVGPTGGGLYQFELRGKPTDDGKTAIVLGWSVYQAISDNANPPPSGERTLIPDAPGFRLRYFGSPKANVAPFWADTWTRNDIMPDLVKVTGISAGSGASADEVIELRLRSTP